MAYRPRVVERSHLVSWLIARLRHSRSNDTPQLSSRQRKCLELAAQGEDDWTIGQVSS